MMFSLRQLSVMKQLDRGFAKTFWLRIGVGLTTLWNVKKQCITLILLMKKIHGKKNRRPLSTTTNDIFTTRQKYKCHIKNCTQKLKETLVRNCVLPIKVHIG